MTPFPSMNPIAPNPTTRREFIAKASLAGLAAVLGSQSLRADPNPPRRVLVFTKCSNYIHDTVKGGDGSQTTVGKVLSEIAARENYQLVFSKDGSLFTPEYLDGFDAFFFYTSGDLLAAGHDGNPPMTAAGKAAFLEAIRKGKGFIGSHSAADTFHTGEDVHTDTSVRTQRYKNYGDGADPYTRMLGAGFIIHGKQQDSTCQVVDPAFPGMAGWGPSFHRLEEWYSLNDFSKDLHVLLVMETADMKGNMYKRPPYPSTWARMHGKGRVFYSAMAHRDDTWADARFQGMITGAFAWATGRVDAAVPANIAQVTPGAWDLPPMGA